jgi:hypothetical protein
MKYQKSIIAISITLGLGLAGVVYAAEEGSGQGGMQPGTSKGSLANPGSQDLGSSSQGSSSSQSKKKSGEAGLGMEKDQQGTRGTQDTQSMQKEQQKDSPSIPDTVGTTEGRGDRFGESGTGQGSGGGAGTKSGIGNR